MRSALLAVWIVAMVLSAAPESIPVPCTCTAAKDTNGWCDAHGVGYVATLRIPSRLLYETLDAHGHTLDLSTFECPICKKAIKTDGFCAQHRVGFVRNQVYFSRLTYELARGETTDPSRIACRTCRRNAQSYGWCKTHRVGMVGRIALKDPDGYQAVVKAINILKTAVAAIGRCEYCALAIVTDSQCPRCRITYKDGKPLSSGPRRAVSVSK